MLELLHTGRFTDIGVCFDVGHANLAPGVKHAFETLKDVIRTTHVHDNHGEKDEHLWPCEGSVDWKETIELLRSAPQVPALVLEIEGVEGERVSEKMASTYGKLEA